jgi:hypothetical protein
MYDWRNMSLLDLNEYFADFGNKLRSGELNRTLGIEQRKYLIPLAYGVKEAIMCGYDRLAVAEFGVFYGAGLLDLCNAAKLFRDDFGLDIQVYGFDRGTGGGLPGLVNDYRDHPELFQAGEFKMPNQEALRAKLPDFCELVIGDVGDTVRGFEPRLAAGFWRSQLTTLIFTPQPSQRCPSLPLPPNDTYRGCQCFSMITRKRSPSASGSARNWPFTNSTPHTQ